MPKIFHRLFVTSRFDTSTYTASHDADYLNKLFQDLAMEFEGRTYEEKYKYLWNLLRTASCSELPETTYQEDVAMPIDFNESTITLKRADLKKILDEGSNEVMIKDVTLCHMTHQNLKLVIED